MSETPSETCVLGFRLTWSQQMHTVPEFYDSFRDNLPQIIQVADGFYGQSNADTFDSGQLFCVVAVRKQKRVLCHDPAHQRHLCIPVTDLPMRFFPIQGHRHGPPKTLEEMLESHGLPLSVQVVPTSQDQKLMIAGTNFTSGQYQIRLLETFEEPFFLAHTLVTDVPVVDQTHMPIMLSAKITLHHCIKASGTFGSYTSIEQVLRKVLDDVDYTTYEAPSHVTVCPGDNKPQMQSYGPAVYGPSSLYVPLSRAVVRRDHMYISLEDFRKRGTTLEQVYEEISGLSRSVDLEYAAKDTGDPPLVLPRQPSIQKKPSSFGGPQGSAESKVQRTPSRDSKNSDIPYEAIQESAVSKASAKPQTPPKRDTVSPVTQGKVSPGSPPPPVKPKPKPKPTPIGNVKPSTVKIETSSSQSKSLLSLADVPKDVSDLSVGQVADCLKLLNMKQYSRVFTDELVDGATLVDLAQDNDGELLKGAPFSLPAFHAKKLIRFAVQGWRPKMGD